MDERRQVEAEQRLRPQKPSPHGPSVRMRAPTKPASEMLGSSSV